MLNYPLVYIIIVAWNHFEDTIECLRSVNSLQYPNKRVLLVDNGSSDGTPEKVRVMFPEIDLIISKSNLGFARACNIGLKFAIDKGADYFFILNNDTIVDPKALDHLIKLIGGSVGMVAPKIYYMNDPRRIWSIGGIRATLTLEKKGDARGQLDEGQFCSPLERDYLVGCALLISRELVNAVGLFDERYFMYYEDSDLSLRAIEKGYKLLLAPDAYVWHKVATSSGGADSPNERYWMARSSIIFFANHVKGWRLAFVVPYRIVSAVKTILRLGLRRKWHSIRAYVIGLYDGVMEVLGNKL